LGAFLFAADEIILPLNKPIAETPNKPKGNPFKNDLLETLLLFKITSQLQKYTNQNYILQYLKISISKFFEIPILSLFPKLL
tara:strand:- start:3856 stop:4101 length:246 start_codon:yes stop_codon:yes gene_type:complete